MVASGWVWVVACRIPVLSAVETLHRALGDVHAVAFEPRGDRGERPPLFAQDEDDFDAWRKTAPRRLSGFSPRCDDQVFGRLARRSLYPLGAAAVLGVHGEGLWSGPLTGC